jgi:hypothetical protein
VARRAIRIPKIQGRSIRLMAANSNVANGIAIAGTCIDSVPANLVGETVTVVPNGATYTGVGEVLRFDLLAQLHKIPRRVAIVRT